MFPSLVVALNKPAPTSYWGNSSVVICWEDSFTWLWWDKKRRLACIYNVLREVTHLIVYTPTSIIFEVLPHTWMKTLNHKLWNITFPMFDLPQLYIWMQAQGHKLWSTSRCLTSINTILEWKLLAISYEILPNIWPLSTVYSNANSRS